MDLHTGSPYWFLINGLRTVVPPLAGDTTCDVVVIGAGITGSLVCHELLAVGLDVVVLDGGDLANGSTVASTALLQYDLDVPLHRLCELKGREQAERAFRSGVEAIQRLQAIGAAAGSPVRRVPSVYALLDGSRRDELEAEFVARKRAGLDVAWLEAGEAMTRWGMEVVAAIESSQAAEMDPYGFTHQLWREAIASGARVYDRTRVMSVVERGGDRLRLVTDRGASVECSHVVYATGYEAARYLPKDAVKLVSTYAFASEPMRRPASEFMAWEYNDPYLYTRWTGDRLIVGGGDVPFVDEDKRDRLIGAKSNYLARRIRSLMPGVDPEIGFAWTGTFATTDDGLGYIGPLPERERETIALGFGGNGITMSALAGGIIRDHILGRHNDLAELYRPGRAMGRAPAMPAGRG